MNENMFIYENGAYWHVIGDTLFRVNEIEGGRWSARVSNKCSIDLSCLACSGNTKAEAFRKVGELWVEWQKVLLHHYEKEIENYEALTKMAKDTIAEVERSSPMQNKWTKGAPLEGCRAAWAKLSKNYNKQGGSMIRLFSSGCGGRSWTVFDPRLMASVGDKEILAHYPLDDIIKAGEGFCCEC